ncbi:DUF4880 domain-containing protein [Exilibacterium tricleocarpae]|uniref:DUF4880 domain-containing protein n=1 Tax=Exilibacterium tricleocarpae TaxID=2591008 RepID=A0A545T8D3_9GAMM|nr:FecR domain-containing protein [Exilibacterium tricleocarpae]TQV73471.1 DUF4880 domain-containing protein [Exilibacterium tricleocarpae]
MNISAQTARADRRRIRQEAAAWYAKLKSPRCDRAARRAFKQWLAQSPLHELAYEQCRALWDISGHLGADGDIRRELTAAQATAADTGRRRAAAARYLQVAAVVVVLVAGGWFVTDNRSVDIYGTGVGEHRLVRLDDGSTALLNTDTVIAVNYSRAARRLELRRGEAFFAVAADPQRPFEVAAAGSVVRALGTEFNVLLRARAVSVTVAEGVVELEGRRGPDGVPRTQIERGEAATYHDDGVTPAIEPAELERITAWRNSKIYFKSSRLADAVLEYNRYTRTPIEILDKDLEDHLISGIFQVGDLTAFVFSLEQLLDVRVVRDNDRIYLMRRVRAAHPTG